MILLILNYNKGNEDYFMKKCNWKKVLSITGNVIFYAVIVLILLFAFSNIKTKKADDIATLFGRGYVAILTDSMKGEFEEGDLIFVKVLNEEEKKELDINDVITFWDFTLVNPYTGENGAFNTHRIVDIDRDTWQFQTKGDNEEQVDTDWKTLDQVKALYVGKAKNVGKAIGYLQSSKGMLLFIVLPTILFLGYELFLFIRVLLKANAEKVEEKLSADKDKMRQELLEELKKQQNEQSEETQK